MTIFQIENKESNLVNLHESYGTFVISPLHIGQGITIGNALRRTLLAEIPGVAITGVSIPTINTEFSSIPSIREDFLELCLNLKQISFQSDLSKKTIGTLAVQGPAIITAESFQVSTGVRILNPQQYIATVAENKLFKMEIAIEKGTGYQLATINSTQRSIDFLPIDAVFSPIKKVVFDINSISKHLKTLHEEVIIEIWTDGSLSAIEALSQAASNLMQLFQDMIVKNENSAQQTHNEEEFEIANKEQPKLEKTQNDSSNRTTTKIEILNLSTRAYNCLKKQQIDTIEDLLKYSKKDLTEIKNFGKKSIDEVLFALKNQLNLTLQ
uniref:DNA-directed RNA polymerase subunit alpha n=1 Tax=Olisthodiscus luteus TaxID=83000 RepID=A0A7U0QGD5_OLILU|nr:RNA polymerase subunit alpha [Olisthodiscus luteus]QQW50575.1 RNA polymerase subunit alpha [Olisthodiscus luteus]